nr:hypothetical protein [Tanacetum cinerariifolium]
MSDSKDSAVTYTAVSSPFRDLSEIRSLGVDGSPVMPEDPYAYVVAAFQAPPSPDYVLGLEYPPSPEFIPEPLYPEFMPPKDEILPAEEQPLPTAASPTTESLGYIDKSDPDEDPEEDPADYPADGGDDDDDESPDDDEEDDDDVEEDVNEEEHLAPADSTAVALPVVDHALSAEETEPFKTDESSTTPPPHSAYRVTARMPAGDSSPDYGFISTLDDEIMQDPERDVGYGINDSWDEISERQLMACRLNLLGRDRRAYAHTTLLMGGITTFRVCEVAGDRPQEIGIVHRGTKTADETSDLDDRKMAPKRTTRANLATSTNTTTITVTDAQLKALIEQGVNVALAARNVDRNTNGDDNHVSRIGVRRTERVNHECTYPDFMKCQPLNFKGTKGVIELTQWFEKMETVFRISNCSIENKIKFSTCTPLGSALTWWNSHVMTVELALLCVRMFLEESDKIERYVGGLADMIHGSVVASKPKTMHEAIEIATKLMDKKICTFAERHTETKRKHNDNQQQQQQNKRQNTKKRGIEAGQKPTCYKCGAQGHFKKDCPKLKNNNRGTQGGNATAPAKVYAVGRAGTNQDSKVVTGM